jgi:hypothetical protein
MPSQWQCEKRLGLRSLHEQRLNIVPRRTRFFLARPECMQTTSFRQGLEVEGVTIQSSLMESCCTLRSFTFFTLNPAKLRLYNFVMEVVTALFTKTILRARDRFARLRINNNTHADVYPVWARFTGFVMFAEIGLPFPRAGAGARGHNGRAHSRSLPIAQV